MKIFLIGGSGFLGTQLLKELTQDSRVETIICLCHSTPISVVSDKIVQIYGDVRNVNELMLDVPIDVCVVVSGITNGLKYTPEIVKTVNATGTDNAILFCRRNNIKRIVLTSSVNVCLKTKGAYAKSKKHAETAVRYSGLDYLIFRPALIFGHNIKNGLGVIEAYGRKHGIVPVFGNGKKLEQPIFVDECAKFMVWYIVNEITGRIIGLYGPNPIEYNELCKTIGSLRGLRFKLLHLPVFPFWLCTKIIESLNIPFPINSEQIIHVDSDLTGDMTAIQKETGIEQENFEVNFLKD